MKKSSLGRGRMMRMFPTTRKKHARQRRASNGTGAEFYAWFVEKMPYPSSCGSAREVLNILPTSSALESGTVCRRLPAGNSTPVVRMMNFDVTATLAFCKQWSSEAWCTTQKRETDLWRKLCN